MSTMPTAQNPNDKYFAASPRRKMSSVSGSTPSSRAAMISSPYLSDALHSFAPALAALMYPFGRAISAPHLGCEEPVGTEVKDHDHQHEDAGPRHRPAHAVFEPGLHLANDESRGNRAQQAFDATEHHDNEGVDDILLTGRRAGRCKHREGTAGDAGKPAAERKGKCVDLLGIDAG